MGDQHLLYAVSSCAPLPLLGNGLCSKRYMYARCHHHHSIQDQGLINNYRGFSLLSIVGKVFGRVAVSHLQCLSSQFTLSNSAGSDLAGQQLCE